MQMNWHDFHRTTILRLSVRFCRNARTYYSVRALVQRIPRNARFKNGRTTLAWISFDLCPRTMALCLTNNSVCLSNKVPSLLGGTSMRLRPIFLCKLVPFLGRTFHGYLRTTSQLMPKHHVAIFSNQPISCKNNLKNQPIRKELLNNCWDILPSRDARVCGSSQNWRAELRRAGGPDLSKILTVASRDSSSLPFWSTQNCCTESSTAKPLALKILFHRIFNSKMSSILLEWVSQVLRLLFSNLLFLNLSFSKVANLRIGKHEFACCSCALVSMSSLVVALQRYMLHSYYSIFDSIMVFFSTPNENNLKKSCDNVKVSKIFHQECVLIFPPRMCVCVISHEILRHVCIHFICYFSKFWIWIIMAVMICQSCFAMLCFHRLAQVPSRRAHHAMRACVHANLCMCEWVVVSTAPDICPTCITHTSHTHNMYKPSSSSSS